MGKKKHKPYLKWNRGKCPYCGHEIKFGEAGRAFSGSIGLMCSNCGHRSKIEELKDLSLWMPADEYFSSEKKDTAKEEK